MNKPTLINFLISNGKFFVEFFCCVFGVVAQESYQVLKSEKYRFRNVLPKLVLAWFVCLIATPIIKENVLFTKYYPYLIMLLAFLYRPAADWISKDFFPMLSSLIVNLLTKNSRQK